MKLRPFVVHSRYGPGTVVGIKVKHPRPIYVVKLEAENSLVALTLPELWAEEPDLQEEENGY